VIDRDLQSLLRILDLMDDHFDRRVSDEQFVLQAVATLESLDPVARDDPDLAAAVHALEGFVNAARGAPLPLDLYGALRFALADLPEPPGAVAPRLEAAAGKRRGRPARSAAAAAAPEQLGTPVTASEEATAEPAEYVSKATSEPAGHLGEATAEPAERVWHAARTATRIRARLGRSGGCPPELAEAVAGLQDLAVAVSGAAESAVRMHELRRLQDGLPTAIQVARNGPYLVTNAQRVTDYLGNAVQITPQAALCRCGASEMKPLCDGSHARVQFSENKDPKRVPDRRDTYAGEQLTIFDNRGICQHSGFCTDRLAAVFRAGAEPFVAPSGGRMDEIIRAVRDCPSGALSYGVDGVEARDQVDWHDIRGPGIEVTKDGPFRVTGKIALTDAAGNPVTRNEGSSLEHYALCRCGHSQNKPFCSGMHWYVEFTDPVRPPGYEPTLFEWAGGLPALNRMARMLYEKYLPGGPLLAPLYAGMPPEQPQLLAGWVAEALGGSDRGAGNGAGSGAGSGGLWQIIGATSGDFGEEHRVRWVAAATSAADDAKLPGDPGFRSALASCLDWVSRTALAPPLDDKSEAGPVPRWEWAGGPSQAADADQTAKGGEAAEGGEPAAVELPGPDETVRFDAHIKGLFREHDRQSMSFAFDLWSYDDVRAHATEIMAQLRDGDALRRQMARGEGGRLQPLGRLRDATLRLARARRRSVRQLGKNARHVGRALRGQLQYRIECTRIPFRTSLICLPTNAQAPNHLWMLRVVMRPEKLTSIGCDWQGD
jgi:CDGSH-type Zn-finger protein